MRSKAWLQMLLCCGALLGALDARAEEALCAEVVIEIQQEFALERQAFEATMRISNALDTLALENLSVVVLFEDADGTPVQATSDPQGDAPFFIRQDALDGISAVDGTGTIPPSSVAEARWLIIPSGDAAGDVPDGVLYFVGAELAYTYGGQQQRISVAPDSIVVRPQPRLTLDYFLTEDVIADDAFTPEVEPPVPYTLGVRILNNGAGTARSVTLDSAQPRIVENEQGLAIAFRILRAYVGDRPAEPKLLLDFGDVAGGGVATGRWDMESSLSGTFTGIDASFTHADELGGALTSLLEDVQARLLVGNVQVDLPGRDALLDFLVRDGADLFLFESERTGLSEGPCSECASVADLSATATLGPGSSVGALESHLLTVAATGGPHYARVPDPYQGTKGVESIRRSDGRVLAPANAFLTRERAPNETDFEYWLNVFDIGGSGEYEVRFGAVLLPPLAPVFIAVPRRETTEGGQIGFLVRASDPNGDPVVLSADSLPAGASFVDNGNGEGRFQWFPIAGQAGLVTARFRASDGTLSSTLDVEIEVFPGDDIDGDGLVDEWELDNFGDLGRDGTGDADDDGYTDAEEFENGTDPNVREAVPGDPEVDAPAFGSDVLSTMPVLRVRNAISGSTTVVTYVFELYSDAALSARIGRVEGVPETPATTAVVVDADFLDGATELEENRIYHWRARAEVTDGATSWVEGRFRVNVANDPPATFAVTFPEDGSVVDRFSPDIVLTNPVDPEGDAMTFDLEIFVDDGTAAPVVSVSGLALDATDTTTWPLPQPLFEDVRYRLEALARDAAGAVRAAPPVRFLVSTADGAPEVPTVLLPADGGEVAQTDVRLVASAVFDPEGADVVYAFQVDRVPSFDSEDLLVFDSALPEVDVPGRVENTRYFWRVRASDGAMDSPWASASFFVNAFDEAPPAPVVANPGDGAQVETLSPLLVVAPVQDPDEDAVQYVFEVYADPGLAALVTSATIAAPSWTVDLALDDNTNYFWRAAALDEHGLLGPFAPLSAFFVNDDGFDDPPRFTFVEPSADRVEAVEVEIRWTDSDPDSSARIDLRAGGLSIATDLEEDADGDGDRFLWDLAGVAPGGYVLEATIRDATNTVVEYACCTITVPDPVGDAELVVTLPPEPVVDEFGVAVAAIGVHLSRAPDAGETVTVSASALDGGELALNGPAAASFDETNHDQTVFFEVRGVDDCAIDGDVASAVRLGVAATTGSAFEGLAPSEILITTRDNELVGQTLFVCEADVLGAVDEGAWIDYSVRPRLENRGAAIESATATAAVFGGPQELVGAADVSFPAVALGATVSALDPIVLRVPAGEAIAFEQLAWTVTPGGDRSPLAGTSANDALTGTDAAELIEGFAGHDTLRGGGGNDVLVGGAGADTMYGEAGDDVFRIEGSDAHADRVSGGEGVDLVVGGGGDDDFRFSVFSGAFTVERVDGAGGTDRVLGTSANNTLDFSATELVGIARIEGLGGHDTITGSSGDDHIVGGPGADTIRGGGGDDAFHAESADPSADRYDGGAGTDTLYGTPGDDALRLSVFSGPWTVERIDGLGGNDTIYGTSANNTMDFSATELVGIARIDALAGHDTVTGSAGPDEIVGGPGNDTLRGGGGDDVFPVQGDAGTDRFDGGEGFDTVLGSAADDVFRFSVFSGAFTVERIDGNGGSNVVVGTSANNTLDFSGTELLAIARIEGGAGHDTIRGSALADLLVGGPGADSLFGGAGDDVFTLEGADASADRYSGEEGFDTIVGSGEDDTLRLSVFSGQWITERVDLGDGDDVIAGTNANNTLDFSGAELSSVERIDGGLGHDTIRGSDSADTIVGGPGSDSLYGRGGDDVFLFETADGAADRYDGGDGTDTLRGTAQDDVFTLSVFSGSWTVEMLEGGGGVDVVRGTAANNTLDFSNTSLVGVAEIRGENGHDTITGSAGDDVIVGGAGSDTLRGGEGDDRFRFAASDGGADRYDGGPGFDRLEGSAGDDVFRLSVFSGTWRVEEVDGAGGTDRIVGTSANNTLDFSGTTLVGIAEIRGENGHDTITGSDQADTIVGGSGSDTLYGRGGDDVFLHVGDDGGSDRFAGEEGIDVLRGSAGDDVFRLSVFSGNWVVERIEGAGGSDRILGTNANNTLDFSGTVLDGIEYVDAGPGHDTVRGSPGNDLIVVGAGADTVYGGDGDDDFQLAALDAAGDRFSGEAGQDRILGSSADDVLVLSTYGGSWVVDVVDLGAGTDRIRGTNANNTLDFSATQLVGVDAIEGGPGHDTLTGSTADDVLEGGPGNDTLGGRAGSDHYRIAAGDGNDTIRENGDVIGLDRVDFGALAPDALWFYRAGAHLEIHVLGGAGQFVRVVDHHLDPADRIEQVVAGGAVLDSGGLDALVSEMTDIGRPTGGAIALSPEQATAIAASRAQHWGAP